MPRSGHEHFTLKSEFPCVCVQPPAGHDVLRLGIFKATGIFVLSVSGHSSLPVLRNSMQRPQVSTSPDPTPYHSSGCSRQLWM